MAWNPDNVRDVAESVGVVNLAEDTLQVLASDVEFRIGQVLEESLATTRHARRAHLLTRDVSQGLRSLGVEPLYGYEATRPLRFGEASLGPGQPLFYVEDEEVDFEKLINAPLPKVPREMAHTGHWLSVEGVQPSIPQNPASADARAQDMTRGAAASSLAHATGSGGAGPPNGTSSGGPGASASSNGQTGPEGVVARPLVRHVVSRELQLYFERVCGALVRDDPGAGPDAAEARLAALTSVRHDPSLQPLVPYLVQFVAEKVTHGLRDLVGLRRALDLQAALLANRALFLAPYVASMVPPVLTCAVTPRLGVGSGGGSTLEALPLRRLAAELLGRIARNFGSAAHTLRPRLARTLLRHFLDPRRPFAVHYGALLGLRAVAGREGVRVLVLPNLKEYGGVLKEGLDAGGATRQEAEMAVGAVLGALEALEEEDGPLVNGFAGEGGLEAHRAELEEKVGSLIADRVLKEGRPKLVQAVCSSRGVSG